MRHPTEAEGLRCRPPKSMGTGLDGISPVKSALGSDPKPEVISPGLTKRERAMRAPLILIVLFLILGEKIFSH